MVLILPKNHNMSLTYPFYGSKGVPIVVIGILISHCELRGVPAATSDERSQSPAQSGSVLPGEGVRGGVPGDLDIVPVIRVLGYNSIEIFYSPASWPRTWPKYNQYNSFYMAQVMFGVKLVVIQC